MMPLLQRGVARRLVGCEEISEVEAQLPVDFAMEAFDDRLLDGAIHPLDLPMGPRVVGWANDSLSR